MKFKTGSQLAFMMFIEYFIWGAWYVTMGTYMGEICTLRCLHVGAAYSALAIATMISPFFIGLVADRYFPAQRIMGLLHLLGGVLLFFATKVTGNADLSIGSSCCIHCSICRQSRFPIAWPSVK